MTAHPRSAGPGNPVADSPHVPPAWTDAHVHLWDPDHRAQPWMHADRFKPIRRRFSIDDLRSAVTGTPVTRAVLIQNLASTAESLELLAIADRNTADPTQPFHVAGVVGWVDLEAPDIDDQIERQRTSPGGHLLVGTRHPVQDEADPDWLARPAVITGLTAVGTAGLTFDILARTEQLAGALTAIRAAPKCRFVIDHLGSPPVTAGLPSQAGRRWLATLTELAAESNVALKVSGLFTQAEPPWTVAALRPWTEAAASAFDPDRLMFASDWPVCLLAASYPEVASASHDLTADLDGGDPHSMWSSTAQRWYNLAD